MHAASAMHTFPRYIIRLLWVDALSTAQCQPMQVIQLYKTFHEFQLGTKYNTTISTGYTTYRRSISNLYYIETVKYNSVLCKLQHVSFVQLLFTIFT